MTDSPRGHPQEKREHIEAARPIPSPAINPNAGRLAARWAENRLDRQARPVPHSCT